MPAAGDPVYASDVLRARPKFLWDSASAALPASSTAVAITGISIVFTTETANVDLTLWWTIQADPTGAATTLISARPHIAGPSGYAADAPVYATYAAQIATDQGTVGQTWTTQLGAAGTYTLTLLGTTGASEQINLYSTLTACIQEQFA